MGERERGVEKTGDQFFSQKSKRHKTGLFFINKRSPWSCFLNCASLIRTGFGCRRDDVRWVDGEAEMEFRRDKVLSVGAGGLAGKFLGTASGGLASSWEATM